MRTRPRWLRHLEGAALFGLSLLVYRRGHFGRYALLFLAADLFMLGYFLNVRVGAALDNLAPTTTIPRCAVFLAMLMPELRILPWLLLWLWHIGFDRMLGFRPKYPTQFRDTHVQRVLSSKALA